MFVHRTLLMINNKEYNYACKYIVDANGNATMTSPSSIDLTGVFDEVKAFNKNSLNYAFADCTGISSGVVFPKLKTIDDSWDGTSQSYNPGLTIIEYPRIYGLYHTFEGSSIPSVSFPALTSMGAYACYYAFKDCLSLRSIDFPVLNHINSYSLEGAFMNCVSLSSVSFPKLRFIRESSGISYSSYGMAYAFQNCTGLREVSFPMLERIDEDGMSTTFSGCTSLTSVEFPALKSINGATFYQTFQNCTNLRSVSFPALTSAAPYNRSYAFSRAFKGCTNLVNVSFPVLADISSSYAFEYAFNDCTSLTTISFPALKTINSNTFYRTFENCPNLTSIHFRYDARGAVESSNLSAPGAQIYFDL